MKKFVNWIIINIILPLSPFFLKAFVIYMGNEVNKSKIKILEPPDLLFYSIITCILAFNVNLEGNRKSFESLVRGFLFFITTFDLITLGMIYSDNVGDKVFVFSIVMAIIPAVITPIYKMYYMNE